MSGSGNPTDPFFNADPKLFFFDFRYENFWVRIFLGMKNSIIEMFGYERAIMFMRRRMHVPIN
jgi:hypothetical protein